MGWLSRLLKRRKRRRRRRRRGWRPPQMRRRLRTLTLLARVKNDRKYRPSKKNRIRLRRWFGGKGWRRRVRRLTQRQLARAVDLNGNFNIRRLSASARDAMGLTDYKYNALQGKGQLRSRSFNNSGFRKVQKQKREMRVATRNLQNKKLFGANRLKLLQNLAYKNSYNEEIRDKYPGLADARPGKFGGSSPKTLMAKARGGKGIKGRRVKKLVGEHGSWTSARTRGGQFVTLDGKQYRPNTKPSVVCSAFKKFAKECNPKLKVKETNRRDVGRRILMGDVPCHDEQLKTPALSGGMIREYLEIHGMDKDSDLSKIAFPKELELLKSKYIPSLP